MRKQRKILEASVFHSRNVNVVSCYEVQDFDLRYNEFLDIMHLIEVYLVVKHYFRFLAVPDAVKHSN